MDKLTALQRWCDEHRPQEKMRSNTKMATDWSEEWLVGSWVQSSRLKSHLVPDEHRAAFEAAVERSGYKQVRAADSATMTSNALCAPSCSWRIP